MYRGWIKIWRKSEDWRFHPANLDRKYTKYEAFLDLIMMANHEYRRIPFEGEYVEIERAQNLTSLKKLAKRWNWPKSTARDFLKNLERGGEIQMKSERRYTMITICNYDKYQSVESTNPHDTRLQSERSPHITRHKQELKEFEELKEAGDYGKPGKTQI